MSTQPNLSKKSTAAGTGASARDSPSPGPAEIAAQTSVEEVQRVKQFPLRLKNYVRWIRQFLHGGK
jgi:hypothetical protein